MSRRGQLHSGLLSALLALGAIAGGYLTGGGQMFSPGPLNAQNRRGQTLGGVGSHAETKGRCAACHVSPWNRAGSAERCLDCHENIRRQQNAHAPLHGMIANSGQCRSCHSEHHGPLASLTSFEHFDHDWTAFPLTGRHRGLACSACHTRETYQGTPQSCVACHAEPKVHAGCFGTNCAQCHSTAAWTGATFDHHFPLNHGGGPKHRPKACAQCHTNSDDYRSYTCYGCHRHDPHKTEQKHLKRAIADIDQCAKCHPDGRKRRPGAHDLAPSDPEIL